MQIKKAEAHDLLRKWYSDSVHLGVMFAAEGVGVTAGGRLSRVTDELTIQIDGVIFNGRKTHELMIDLSAATFDYQDSREAPPNLQGVKDSLRSCLTVNLQSGDRLALYEFA